MIEEKPFEKEIRQQIKKEEDSANRLLSYFLFGVMIVMHLVYLITIFKIIQTDYELVTIAFGVITSLSFVAIGLTHFYRCYGKWIKYMLISSIFVILFMINLLTGNKMKLIISFGLIVCFRYHNSRLIYFSYAISCLLLLLNAFVNAFVLPYFGYIDLNTVSFPNGSQILVGEGGWLFKPVINAGLDSKRILINSIVTSALPSIISETFVAAVGLMIVNKGEHMIGENLKMSQERLRLEKELSETKTKIMLSQIQPHFLYNSLTAIMAIEGNPDDTVNAIGTFGKYLRENLDSLKENELISVKKELEHVEKYFYLEKLRFKNRIDVIYDIESDDIMIPPLSIQLLVENAVKHGLEKKVNGGTVKIRTWENESECLIEVSDNGVGFDQSKINLDEKHIGIDNLKIRLKNYQNGRLEIRSTEGEGSVFTIHIPKGGNYEDISR